MTERWTPDEKEMNTANLAVSSTLSVLSSGTLELYSHAIERYVETPRWRLFRRWVLKQVVDGFEATFRWLAENEKANDPWR